jgi:hypothetical protein
MDSYQAIYDAVRSRIVGADVGSAVADVARSALAMEDFDKAWLSELAVKPESVLTAIGFDVPQFPEASKK